MNRILKCFGRNVRKHRHEKGISQEDLAEICSLHRTYISSVERGERNISLQNIVKIARALNVTLQDLQDGIGNKL
jgi:transcriptional regulator with XRE-family HTH domain